MEPQYGPVEPTTVVREVLGRVDARGKCLYIEKTGAGNSTRWVFVVDLRHERLEVRLLHYLNEKPLSLKSLALAMSPMNTAFYDAQVFMNVKEDGRIVFCRDMQGPPPMFMVTVDALVAQELRVARERS